VWFTTSAQERAVLTCQVPTVGCGNFLVHNATQRILCVVQQLLCYCVLGPHNQRFVNSCYLPPPPPFSVNVMIRVVAGRLSSRGFPVRAGGSFLFFRPPSLTLDERRER
jgi:hypothetical protein